MNENKFLTLLMGDKWYEWPEIQYHGCNFNPDHLSNPLPVIRWMEKEMPDEWEEYVDYCFVLFRYDKREAYECLNKVLDLNNLITYLSEHREWGDKECPEGKIKHPTMIYPESEEDKDDT